jgi:diguanylate cyclase (GGDEF)-like protein
MSHLRAGDFVARVGGEEFLIGCVGAPGDVALALAQRLNESVGQLQVQPAIGTSTVVCTVSVGVSCSIANYRGWEAGARQADQALYQAKAEGRNGVRPFIAPMAA